MEKKIKILFFIERLCAGGAEKVLCNLVNNMDQKLFDVTVQTVWPCDAHQFLVSGIHYKFMYSSENRLNRLRYRAEAESRLAYRLHINDDYDIECAYLEMGPTKVMSASTNKKAKKLAWVHCDLKQKVGDAKTFAKKTACWYRSFDKVICVSQNVRESFVDLFGKMPESIVVYNTVNDEEIREKAKQPCPMNPRKLTALAIGRLTEQKGFDRLLEAHRNLQKEGLDYDLWILGDGPDRNKLEKLIQENNLQNSVRLLGFDVNPYPYMRVCDFYVCSSRYEGMSTTVIEALILGKPIVTTDCTGMRELLGDSKYGIINSSNVAGIQVGMQRMLTDSALRKAYEEKAVEKGKEFSASKLTYQTEKLFLELTGV